MAAALAALLAAGYLQAGAQCRVKGVVADAGGQAALGDVDDHDHDPEPDDLQART